MSELDEQIAHRKAKLAALRDEGVDPYPRLYPHDLEPAGVHARFADDSAEQLEAAAVGLRVPGRVQAIRSHGKTVFVDLGDGVAKLQVLIRSHKLDEDSARVLANLDLGDYLGVAGTLMRTRTGELTLAGETLTLLAKALRPMPEKYHGLADVEARYRQRYLDLIANPESRQVFETRAAITRGTRTFLDGRGFLEVETPMMQPLAGGATARPFTTHHNALDLDLFLRVAPELFLKRLVVGGLHKVYEINRNFRNEGISTQHNPEFTMLELYWAYTDYRDIAILVEELFVALADEILGERALTWKGERLDLTPPWPRLTMLEATATHGGLEPERLTDAAFLEAEIKRRGGELPKVRDWGHLLLALFEEVAEPHLQAPTFIIDHPVEISPLAKQKPDDPKLTERFELYVGGMELANAFSELNDPQVQAERFRQQLGARDQGDDEAHRFDADYILALEHGMPPAGGLGIGMDRLTMLFTDRASIRDVILFPLLRPQARD
jgi:lysyl-tRNA synthetase class 2